MEVNESWITRPTVNTRTQVINQYLILFVIMRKCHAMIKRLTKTCHLIVNLLQLHLWVICLDHQFEERKWNKFSVNGLTDLITSYCSLIQVWRPKVGGISLTTTVIPSSISTRYNQQRTPGKLHPPTHAEVSK